MNIYVISPKSHEMIGVAPIKAYIGAYTKIVFAAPDVDYIIKYIKKERIKRVEHGMPLLWGFYHDDDCNMDAELIGSNSDTNPGIIASKTMSFDELRKLVDADDALQPPLV